MSLHIRTLGGKKLNLMASLVAIFALVISPYCGLVADYVASATGGVVSQSGLESAIAGTDSIIEISANFTVDKRIDIDRPVTLNGNGFTIDSTRNNNPNDNSNNAVLGINSTSGVVINNLTVQRGTAQRVHGINVWHATASLNNVTVSGFNNGGTRYGLVVGEDSDVTVDNITTSGNSYGINVDKGSAHLTVNGQSHHSESWGIFAQSVGGGNNPPSRVTDNNNQYRDLFNSLYTLKSAPGAPTITAPVSPVTTSSSNLTWTAPSTSGNKNSADSYLVSINGGVAVSVSGLTHPLTGLSDGSYTATVQSVAKSGLLGGIATHNYTVAIPDTEKPRGSATYTGGYLASSGVRYVQKIEDLSFTVNATDNKGVARAIYFAKNVAQPGVEACGNWNAGALTNHNFPAPLQTSVSYTVPGSSIKTCDPSMQWASGSRYNFIHAVFDTAGNQSESFNDPNQLVEIDSTQPVIQIISPLAGSTKNGVVQVEARVIEDGSGVEYVNAKFTDGLTPEFGSTALTLKPGTTDTYVGQINTAGHDGKFSLTVSTRDNVGNTRSAKAQNITIDNTAPKILTVNLNKVISKDSVNLTSNLFNSGKLDATITTDEATAFGTQVGFAIPGMAGPPAIGWTPFTPTGGDNEYISRVSLVERTDTSNPNFTPGFLNNKTFQNTRLYIRTRDALGNVAYTYYKVDANGNFSYTGTDYKFTIDNEKPTGSATYSGGNNVSGVRYIKTASDLKYTATLSDAGALDQTSFVVFKLNPDGTRMRNSAGDALFCGNWRNSSSTINLSGTSVVLSDKSIDGCTWSNGGSWGDGLYAIGHIVYDTVGHSTSFNTTEQRFVIDKTNPVVSVSPSTTGTLSGTVDFEITVSDTNLDTNQLKKVQVWFSKDDDWNQKKGALIDLSSGTATLTVNTEDLHDGKYMLRIPAFTDLAGNYQVGGIGPNGKDKLDSYFRWYLIDNTAPEAPTNLQWKMNITNTIKNSGEYSNIDSGKAIWQHPNASDIHHYLYFYWNDISGNPWKEDHKWQYTGDIFSPELAGSFTEGEGKHFYCVKAVDAVGNESACSAPFNITYDKTAPTVSITSPTGPIDTTKPFTISGTYSDNLSGIGRLHLYASANGKEVVFYVSALSGTPNIEHDYSYNLSSTDLTKLKNDLNLQDGQTLTIKAWAYDRANNWSNATSALTSDTSAPVAEILSPATGTVVQSANGMEIKLHATDTVGMKRFDVTVWDKNDPRTDSSTIRASWGLPVPSGDTKDWTTSFNLRIDLNLPDGEYTIYFTATDLQGRYGNAESVHFTVDSTPPAVAITGPTGTINNTSPTITGTVDADAKSVEVSLDGGWVPATYIPGETTWQFTVPSALANGTHTVQARATDNQGNTGNANEQFATSEFIVAVTTPPTDNGNNENNENTGGNTDSDSDSSILASRPIVPILPSTRVAPPLAVLPPANDDSTTDNSGDVAGDTSSEKTDKKSENGVLASEDEKNHWALANLILSIIIWITTIMALVGLARKGATHKSLRLATLVPSIGAAVIVVFFTNFMANMGWVDIWTIPLIILAIAQVALLSKARESVE